MKRFVKLLAAAAVLSVSGCFSGAGAVNAENIKPTLDPVLDRHDGYVMADATLSELEKRTYLRSTELLRNTFNEAAAKAEDN